MNIEAIIFDKDGTLIDFDAFWVTVSVRAIEDVLKRFDKDCGVAVSRILEELGVHNGATDINGILCQGTYEQIGCVIYKILKESECKVSCNEVVEAVVYAYNKNFEAGEVKPTCRDLIEILTELKRRNKKLAVVTTDNELMTHKCLKALGVELLFDKIYTDDGKTPTKPNPYCVFDFCEFAGVEKERMVMVGDTITDVDFARNAGIAMIGFAKNGKNKSILWSATNTVISEMSQLLDILQ